MTPLITGYRDNTRGNCLTRILDLLRRRLIIRGEMIPDSDNFSDDGFHLRDFFTLRLWLKPLQNLI
jgi:hypothetical protein